MNALVVALAMWLVVQWWGPADGKRLAVLTNSTAPGLEARLGEWWSARLRRRRGQAETTHLLQALVAELRAGVLPAAAFTQVLGAEYGEPDALLQHPPTADADVWRDVAHVWAVASDAGFSLATAMQRLHAHAVREQSVFREATNLAAGPRYTGLVMAVMPFVVLAGASTIGSSPLVWLFTTPPGWVVLALGAALDAGGLAFTHFSVKRVLR